MRLPDHNNRLKLRLVLCTMTVIAMSGCGTASRTEEKLEIKSSASIECYGHYTDKDSVFMKVAYAGDGVTGDIIYKLFEKDKNVGDFEGTLHGDTIFAVYNFVSEGQASTREIVFLKQGNTLVEGFAAMDESGTRFKNRETVDFAGIVLQSEGCLD